MADHSAIEWTDATWNPMRGCSRVSEGCRHCYAEGIAARFSLPGNTFHGFAERTADGPRWTGAVVLMQDRLVEPLIWKRPRRIFVNSMSDLFHEQLSDAAIDQVFAVMALAHQHTFQILTKRAERMRAYMTDETRWSSIEQAADVLLLKLAQRGTFVPVWPLPNVWLGVSVENQYFANERIPLLLQTPAAVRFISAEPLLGPVSLDSWMDTHDVKEDGEHTRWCTGCFIHNQIGAGLDWVIVGGESGPGARPFDVAWPRSIVRQCAAARVACFVKQFGAHVRDRNDAGFDGSGVNDIDGRCSWPEMDPDDIEDSPDGYRDDYQGAPVRVHLRDKKGGDPAEWPADLRVREYPQ